ncbi:MAG: hypothetical protein LBP53_00780 [Candidatus Peribacteria bacterium]|jgi:hypothetical protein|nr:hypothetical protein [Candidatus Peribacteria bacterium]
MQACFTSLKMLLPHMVALLEYLVLTIIVMIAIFWLFALVFGKSSDILTYLPVFGFLGVVLYSYNQCDFQRTRHQILAFLVVMLVYFCGITLLKSTFAL